MAKKRAVKKSAKRAKKAKKSIEEQVVLDPDQDKALRLVGGSAKIQAELEKAVVLAVAKTIRSVMKDHGILLTSPQASGLMSIWFGE